MMEEVWRSSANAPGNGGGSRRPLARSGDEAEALSEWLDEEHMPQQQQRGSRGSVVRKIDALSGDGRDGPSHPNLFAELGAGGKRFAPRHLAGGPVRA